MTPISIRTSIGSGSGVALVAGLLIGCNSALVAQSGKSTGAAVPAANASVEVVIAGKPAHKTLRMVSTQPARIEAMEQTPLHSKLSGYVAEVLVDLGDLVKQDQLLIRLHVPEMEVELQQREASIDQSLAETKQAEAAVRSAQAAVATAEAKAVQAESGISRAMADEQRWRSEFARIGQLAESGSVNRQLVDETQQKLRSAEAARREAEAAIVSAKAAVQQTQADVDKAKADVMAAKARERVAQANRNYSQTMLAYAEIKAPYAGVITQRRIDVGQYVQPASGAAQPLLVIARTDVMRVFAAVPEMEASLVDRGDAVTIEVQSLRGALFEGQVSRTAWALDAANRTLETIIDLDNRSGQLRPGMYAMAKIQLAERKDALTLPAAAVVRQGRDASCYLARDGKATKLPIQLGLRVADDFEVVSGLSGEETVIFNKAAMLRGGQAVDVKSPESE